jgi:hypothetical protein
MQQERQESILAACRGVEAKIDEIGRRLLDPRPEAIDRCQNELHEVAVVLRRLVAEGGFPRNSALSSTLSDIRRSAQTLKIQAECASNLCSGWLQLRLGSGYTKQGLPLLVRHESGSSFEA